MSKTYPINVNQTNFRRQLVTVAMAPARHHELQSVLEQTLQLLAKHLPGTQEDIQKLGQAANQRGAQLTQQESELILRGHGPRGSFLSEQIRDEKSAQAFEALLPKTFESPVDPSALMAIINDYLSIDLISQGQKATVMPNAELFGARFHDITASPNMDLLTAEDGIYQIVQEQFALFTLRVTVDEKTLLLFSSQQGPSLVTYSEIEKTWLQHTCWQYADRAQAEAKLREFFASANVHAPSQKEIQRLVEKVRKALKTPALAEALAAVAPVREDGLHIDLPPVFTLVASDDSMEIVANRKDVMWDEITSFTKRHIFDNAVVTIDKLISEATPKTSPAKKAAKKSAKHVKA